MLIIHVFISGKGNYDTFIKTLKYYKDFSKIVILKSDNNVPDDAKAAHQLIREDCEGLTIDFEEVEYRDGDVEDEISVITNIKKDNPKAIFYFNVTGGKKPEAIMATIASLWIGGIAYYWPELSASPLEFPIPRISVNNLARNKLHLKILECIDDKPQNQNEIKRSIKSIPGKNKELTPQALSNSINVLESYGLVKKDRKGRETIVSITLSGKIAYSMVNKKE